VHFEKSDMYGSLPRTSGTLKSENINEQITRARCTLKKVTCEDHYLARVEISKANPWTNNYHARGALWKKWHVRIATTREWNFEKPKHERTTNTRKVHFEKGDMW